MKSADRQKLGQRAWDQRAMAGREKWGQVVSFLSGLVSKAMGEQYRSLNVGELVSPLIQMFGSGTSLDCEWQAGGSINHDRHRDIRQDPIAGRPPVQRKFERRDACSLTGRAEPKELGSTRDGQARKWDRLLVLSGLAAWQWVNNTVA